MNYAKLLILSAIFLLFAACAGNEASPGAADGGYYLQADEAALEASEATASELTAQGVPLKIDDPAARDGRAALLLRTGDRLGWRFGGSSGSYEVRVRARGTLYQGAPKMRAQLGGEVLGEETVGLDYKLYSFGVREFSSGDRVEVVFTNDKWGGSRDKDRNLFIDHIWLKPIKQPDPEVPTNPTTPEEPTNPEPENPISEQPSPPSGPPAACNPGPATSLTLGTQRVLVVTVYRGADGVRDVPTPEYAAQKSREFNNFFKQRSFCKAGLSFEFFPEAVYVGEKAGSGFYEEYIISALEDAGIDYRDFDRIWADNWRGGAGLGSLGGRWLATKFGSGPSIHELHHTFGVSHPYGYGIGRFVGPNVLARWGWLTGDTEDGLAYVNLDTQNGLQELRLYDFADYERSASGNIHALRVPGTRTSSSLVPQPSWFAFSDVAFKEQLVYYEGDAVADLTPGSLSSQDFRDGTILEGQTKKVNTSRGELKVTVVRYNPATDTAAASLDVRIEQKASANRAPYLIYRSAIHGTWGYRTFDAITAHHYDPDGDAISRVELRVDGEVVSQTVPTYNVERDRWESQLSWEPKGPGSYEVEFIAYDERGLRSADTSGSRDRSIGVVTLNP